MVQPSHSGLVWPRSDGDSSRWPRETDPSSPAWYDKLHETNSEYNKYQDKVGAYLAQYLGLPPRAPAAPPQSHRIPLPEGYALFSKPRIKSPTESDEYLFGSRHALKFRSPNEFFPHAEWLFDTSKPLSDHSQCGCKYNPSSELAKDRKAGNPSKPKRPSTGSPVKAAKVKKPKREEILSSEEVGLRGVIPERNRDHTTGRRFRKGELVWFRIDTIEPPANERGLPLITHWPGLLADVVHKSRIIEAPNGLSETNGSSSTQKEIVQYQEHHVRPLGLFSPHENVVKDIKELLPFALGDELLGGLGGWDLLGQEGTRVVQEQAMKEAREDAEASSYKTLEQRWPQVLGKKIGFASMPREWDSAVYRIAMALKTASQITDAWSQTDRIDIEPDDDMNEEDKMAIMKQEKTLYQGVWWGGERIWQDDMLRMKRDRNTLPASHFAAPSPGAENRAVFVKTNVITIETRKEDNPPNAGPIKWRCMLYGDCYELAEEGWAEDMNGAGPSSEMTLNSVETRPAEVKAKAPKGYAFRQINEPGSEVTIDILDVAGRYYPDLDDSATQSWFIDPVLAPEANQGRVPLGLVGSALMGLKSGTLVYSKSEQWRADLYDIVSKSTKSIEDAMKTFYGKLLTEKGVNGLQMKAKGKESNGSGPGPSGPAGDVASAVNGVAPPSGLAQPAISVLA